MEDEKKLLQKAKNIFKSLKTDSNSVLFSEEKIDSSWTGTIKKNTGRKRKNARKSQCWQKSFGPSRKIELNKK